MRTSARHFDLAVIAALLAATPPLTVGAQGAPSPPAAPTPAKPPAPAKPTTKPAAKPAGAPTAGPAANKPATPATPAASKPAAAAPAPATPVDPAKATLTLPQATLGLKGIGPLMATIEIVREGKPPQALHCELFADKAPKTVANFIGLARGLRLWKDPKQGQWVKRPLYDGNALHRVIPELLIQGGDPNCSVDQNCRSAAGTGDPGYTADDEIRPELRFDRGGRLAMANRGPGTAGSQFFITEREASWLTGGHTIFGQCDGAELISELSHMETGSRDLPKSRLTIKRVTISHRGS